MDITDLVTKWLIEESFLVAKLEAPPEARIAWGIGVTTPGAPGLKFTVVMPLDKRDRIILAMGIAISPEHKSALDKLEPTERLRVMHSILSKSLLVCHDCKIAIQPDMVNPVAIAINAEVYTEEIEKNGKPFFMRLLTRFLNTYFAIVSGFNEWHPVLPPSAKEKESRAFM